METASKPSTFTDNPDQTRVWDAYGHAMASALGVEQIMRLAIFHHKAMAIVTNKSSSQNKKARSQKLVRNVLEGTFSQVSTEFRRLHPELENEAIYCQAMDEAVEARNLLAHRFLAHHQRNLRTEEGLDIMAVECAFYRNLFNRLEQFLRERVAIDWNAWLKSIEPRPDAPQHPLAHLLDED